MSGREKQFLQWYFYHSSYPRPTSFSEDMVNRNTSSVSKPGLLRAMLGPFSAASNAADAAYFKGTVDVNPLNMPVLATGGRPVWGQSRFCASRTSRSRVTGKLILRQRRVMKAGFYGTLRNAALGGLTDS